VYKYGIYMWSMVFLCVSISIWFKWKSSYSCFFLSDEVLGDLTWDYPLPCAFSAWQKPTIIWKSSAFSRYSHLQATRLLSTGVTMRRWYRSMYVSHSGDTSLPFCCGMNIWSNIHLEQTVTERNDRSRRRLLRSFTFLFWAWHKFSGFVSVLIEATATRPLGIYT